MKAADKSEQYQRSKKELYKKSCQSLQTTEARNYTRIHKDIRRLQEEEKEKNTPAKEEEKKKYFSERGRKEKNVPAKEEERKKYSSEREK